MSSAGFPELILVIDTQAAVDYSQTQRYAAITIVWRVVTFPATEHHLRLTGMLTRPESSRPNTETIKTWLRDVSRYTISQFASRRKNDRDTVNSSYRSDVLNMFLIVFALICCIIFVLLFLWGRNKCLHKLTSWRVTSVTHIDLTYYTLTRHCYYF